MTNFKCLTDSDQSRRPEWHQPQSSCVLSSLGISSFVILCGMVACCASVRAESKPHAIGTNLTSHIKTDKSQCACDPLEDFRRAGNPQRVSKLARPGNTCLYGGYYLGGGAPWHGEPRRWSEGTWGWDYWGHSFKRRVALRWYHGRKEQGGAGAYEPDGPRLLEK